MKKKNIAGILALLGGTVGIHRFYLGQFGLGIAYLFLVPILITKGLPFLALIGVLDAVILFSMDQNAFDAKYNRDNQRAKTPRPAPKRRERSQPRYENPTPQPRTRRREKTVKKPNVSRSKSNTFLKEGIKKFKDYDYEAAIEDFETALKHDPQHVATHFNLACAQSLMENKDKSFYHLDRAVALGFDDIDAIKTRDHLAYLRIQPEFDQFETNGFRLAKQVATPQENSLNTTNTKQGPSQSPDLLEQLQRLALLKDKGLLTEAEFSAQKERLLR